MYAKKKDEVILHIKVAAAITAIWVFFKFADSKMIFLQALRISFLQQAGATSVGRKKIANSIQIRTTMTGIDIIIKKKDI